MQSMFLRPAIILTFVLTFATAVAAQIPDSPALRPDEQQKKFKLPPGFEIQLVVADPEIGQPMNLNFDARGRLWITHTVEYPYPAKGEGVEKRTARLLGSGEHAPRDRLTIVEGIDNEGKPAKVTHFAQGLNIPIGVTPLADGSRGLVYSIPGIFLCVDDDHDGIAEKRSLLYGTFGNIDTHGMSSSFTRWIDGWIYGTHGYSNVSNVRDGRGKVTRMHSGNTYRFKEDGSHFEQFTFGQVNPFGMTFDPLGNLYDADCHTKPVYLLLRGAKYPHFTAPPDALGWGPEMISHSHGSTGICGPVYYAAENFPADYRDNLFICNPVTGRINRDKLQAEGSTYRCDPQPDFVTCDDGWFRPVDMELGPDGAIYIADFYNAVIGHYEAPLEHPQRDRHRGRIWRIVYRGEADQGLPPSAMPDLTKLSLDALVKLLGDPNLMVRTLATNWIVDKHATEAAAKLLPLLDVGTPETKAHALWILARLGKLEDAHIEKLAKEPSRLVRVQLMKMLAERPDWNAAHFKLAQNGLKDEDGFVRRAAADALGQHPAAENVLPLLAAWQASPAGDTHLIHTIRLALRTHLGDGPTVAWLIEQKFDDEQLKQLLHMASVSPGEGAATLLLNYAQAGTVDVATIEQAIAQVARYGTSQQIDRLIPLVRERTAGGTVQQFSALLTIAAGLAERGTKPDSRDDLRDWVGAIASQHLKSLLQNSPEWTNQPVRGLAASAPPWGVRQRSSTDGNSSEMFFDSIAQGEQLTGILRSAPFELPEQFSFWMCGHNGFPNTNPAAVNHVRLVLENGTEIAREVPPRNDVAREYVWNLKEHVGERAVLEVVDADAGEAYAWIGVGRFSLPVLKVRDAAAQAINDAKTISLLTTFGQRDCAPQLVQLAGHRTQPVAVRVAAMGAAKSLGASDSLQPLLAKMLGDAEESLEIKRTAAALLGAMENEAARSQLVEALAPAPAEVQREIALALCGSAAGAQALVTTIAAGKASGRLLQDKQVADRFQAKASEEMKARAAELLRNLPSAEERILTLIAQRQAAFPQQNRSLEAGRQVFTKNCATCHKLGETGNVVGPQLDGVGLRGLERILEDVLDPSRNVDAAFRTSTITTADGRVLSGLERRREGNLLVFADAQGKEFQIAADDIEENLKTNLSLMPANFGDTLKEQELLDLAAFLLQQAAKP